MSDNQLNEELRNILNTLLTQENIFITEIRNMYKALENKIKETERLSTRLERNISYLTNWVERPIEDILAEKIEKILEQYKLNINFVREVENND